MIDSYSFGRMQVDGRMYSADIIIYPDGRLQDSWWRREGHRVCLADIMEVLEAKPEIILLGTGASGLMKPADDLKVSLHAAGIELLAEPTGQAYITYNNLRRKGEKIAGCFHLTC